MGQYFKNIIVPKEVFFGNDITNFLLNIGSEHIAINLKEVTYCKSQGNYTHFCFLNGKKMLATNALNYYSKLFLSSGFERIGRFHLINLYNIKSIYRRETIILKDNSKINISPKNRERLKQMVKRYNDLSLNNSLLEYNWFNR